MTILDDLYTSIQNKNADALKAALIRAFEQNVDINAYFPQQAENESAADDILNHTVDFTQKPISTPKLMQFNALHFAISKEWLEGVVMLKVAGTALDCPAMAIVQTPTDDVEVCLSTSDLIHQISSTTLRQKIIYWLNASLDPRDWFRDDSIEKLIDESTHRALFQNDIFEKQTEEALAKYIPLFQEHQWFEAPFLIRYWLQTENIPTLNKIKNDWKHAHASLRNFLFETCIVPHFSEPASLDMRLTFFKQWQDYVRFLYTPASAHGSIQHSSFASYWYSPFHDNCPDWLKAKWKEVMRGDWLETHPGLTAEFFNSQFELQSQTLIIQFPLLNKLDKLNSAIAAQNRQSGKEFQPAILAQVSREQRLVPFSQFGQVLLPRSTEVQQRDFAIQLLDIFRKILDGNLMLSINKILQDSKSLSEKTTCSLIRLQEGCRLLSDRLSISVDTLYLQDNLMAELAKVIDTGSPELSDTKKSKLIRTGNSKSKLKKYLANAERNIQTWLEDKMTSSNVVSSSLASVIDSLRTLQISGNLSPRGASERTSPGEVVIQANQGSPRQVGLSSPPLSVTPKKPKPKLSRKETARSLPKPTPNNIVVPGLTLPMPVHEGSPPLLFTLARGGSLDPESQAIRDIRTPSPKPISEQVLVINEKTPSPRSPRNQN